jgi:uncharacterized protein
LERSSDYDLISKDIELFLDNHSHLIFDEAQRLPELFSALRSHIDQFPKKKIILLGSASPSLIKNISESLAGRMAIVDISPFLVWELKNKVQPNNLWVKGAYPALHPKKSKDFQQEWFSAYLKTYLEQDVRELGFRLSSTRLRRLMQMISHLHGQLLNSSELASGLGINYQTVQSYIDIFEGSFLVRRLQPYYVNIGKRLVKSPKVYIRDSGLLHHLYGLKPNENDLLSYPKVGFSWEGFVIEQIISLALLEDSSARAFFWRTSGGAEVDLLLKLKGKLIPIEIKFSKSVSKTKGIEQCMKDLKLNKGFLLYKGSKKVLLSKRLKAIPIDNLWKEGLDVFK